MEIVAAMPLTAGFAGVGCVRRCIFWYGWLTPVRERVTFFMNERQSKALVALQWSIGTGALLWALHGVDLKLMLHAMGAYELQSMLPVFFFALLDYLILGLRLTVLLPGDVGYNRGLAATVLGTGLNCILPAKAGDAIKIIYLTRITRHSIIDISSIIIWDRLLDCALLGTLLVYSWTQAGGERLELGLAVPAAVLVLGVLAFFCLRYWSSFFHSLYARLLPGRLASPLGRLHTSLVDRVSISWLGLGMACTVLAWFTYFMSFYYAVVGMGCMNLTITQMLVVFSVSSLSSAIPALPGAIGVYEGAMVLSLSWFGVDSTSALGMALFFHAVHFLPLALAAICINGRFNYFKRKEF